MKKTVYICLFVFLLGLFAGGAGAHYLYPADSAESASVSPSLTAAAAATSAPSVMDTALAVCAALKAEDFSALSSYVHPDKGVLFVPYSAVEPEKNLKFSAKQVAAFATDASTYIWGITDGEGAPIKMTPKEYVRRYVYNEDYLSASVIGLNTVVKTGNSLENVKEAFPDASFIEFHIPEIDPQYEGMDWTSLKLVFENVNGRPLLIAIIHSQWTI